MYAALWRILPRPTWLRIVILVVLAAAAIAALMLWVFPWVGATFLVEDATVD